MSRKQAGFLLFLFSVCGKFEIRSTKCETNPKFECSNDQDDSSVGDYSGHDPVWIIRRLVSIYLCFGYNNEKFMPG